MPIADRPLNTDAKVAVPPRPGRIVVRSERPRRGNVALSAQWAVGLNVPVARGPSFGVGAGGVVEGQEHPAAFVAPDAVLHQQSLAARGHQRDGHVVRVCVKPSSPTFTSVIGPAVPLTVMLDGYGLALPTPGMMIGVSLL